MSYILSEDRSLNPVSLYPKCRDPAGCGVSSESVTGGVMLLLLAERTRFALLRSTDDEAGAGAVGSLVLSVVAVEVGRFDQREPQSTALLLDPSLSRLNGTIRLAGGGLGHDGTDAGGLIGRQVGGDGALRPGTTVAVACHHDRGHILRERLGGNIERRLDLESQRHDLLLFGATMSCPFMS